MTCEQKMNKNNICPDITEDLGLIEKVITCNETRIFQYDPETRSLGNLEGECERKGQICGATTRGFLHQNAMCSL